MRWFKGSKSAKRVSTDYLNQYPTFQPLDLQKNRSMKEYIRSDPDLAANMRRLVDNILLNDPVLVPKDGKRVANSTIEKYNEQLSTVRFYKVLRSAVYSLIWSGNAFLEVDRSPNGKLAGIYFVDPEYIEFKKDKMGNVVGYKQEVPSAPVKHFTTDRILHLSIDHLSSGVSGESFIGSLEEIMNRKEIAESYLAWIIANNKLNRFWTVKGDFNEEDMIGTIQQLRYTSRDPNKTAVVQLDSDMEIEFRRYFDTEDFEAITSYIDQQKVAILSVLQVPPIIAGNVDSSNRSNSEVQARFVFYNTIRNFQKILIDEFDYEFLNKLGWKNVEFKFPHTDRSITTEVFKTATAMQGLNFTEDAILEYLKHEGFELPKVDKMFNDPVEPLDGSAGMDATGRNPLKPTASREARDKTGIPQNEKKRATDKRAGIGDKRN